LQLHVVETTQFEPAHIVSLRVTAAGTADDAADVAAVRLYRDANANGLLDPGLDLLFATHSGPYPADNGALTLAPAESLVVAAGGEEHWLLTYDLAGTASHGETFLAKVAGPTELVARGVETGLPLTIEAVPIASDTLRIVEPAALALAAGPAMPPAQTIAGSALGLPMLELAVTETTGHEAAVVDSLALRASGTADDLTDILDGGVRLYLDLDADGAVDSTDIQRGLATRYDADNGVVRFRFPHGAPVVVPPAGTIYLLLTYDLAGTAALGETFAAALETGSALRAAGSYTGGRLAVSGAPVQGNVMTVGATAVAAEPAPPRAFALHPNRPNPFNPPTVIPFDLPEPAGVRLVIYNVAGRTVRTLLREHRPAGAYTLLWDGRNDAGREVASGTYFVRIEAGRFGSTRKLDLSR
jgi:hypothetical protein